MTTKIKKEHVHWLVMRYPEHAMMFQNVFTLAELVERFFDSTSGLNIIAKAFCPDAEDIEQIDKALLLRLWWLSDVEQSAVEIMVSWLSEFRPDTEH